MYVNIIDGGMMEPKKKRDKTCTRTIVYTSHPSPVQTNADDGRATTEVSVPLSNRNPSIRAQYLLPDSLPGLSVPSMTHCPPAHVFQLLEQSLFCSFPLASSLTLINTCTCIHVELLGHKCPCVMCLLTSKGGWKPDYDQSIISGIKESTKGHQARFAC
jgi:hypothetical protein